MRRATVSDAEAIARIHVEAYEESLRDVVSQEVLDHAAAHRHPMWLALLSEPPWGQDVFVHDDETVSGFISAGPSREPDTAAGEVYAIFVDPRQWGSGIGGALLERGLVHLRSLGLTTAKLWVLDRNLRARRFYEARGWVDTEEVREDVRGRFHRYARRL